MESGISGSNEESYVGIKFGLNYDIRYETVGKLHKMTDNRTFVQFAGIFF